MTLNNWLLLNQYFIDRQKWWLVLLLFQISFTLSSRWNWSNWLYWTMYSLILISMKKTQVKSKSISDPQYTQLQVNSYYINSKDCIYTNFEKGSISLSVVQMTDFILFVLIIFISMVQLIHSQAFVSSIIPIKRLEQVLFQCPMPDKKYCQIQWSCYCMTQINLHTQFPSIINHASSFCFHEQQWCSLSVAWSLS